MENPLKRDHFERTLIIFHHFPRRWRSKQTTSLPDYHSTQTLADLFFIHVIQWLIEGSCWFTALLKRVSYMDVPEISWRIWNSKPSSQITESTIGWIRNFHEYVIHPKTDCSEQKFLSVQWYDLVCYGTAPSRLMWQPKYNVGCC